MKSETELFKLHPEVQKSALCMCFIQSGLTGRNYLTVIIVQK